MRLLLEYSGISFLITPWHNPMAKAGARTSPSAIAVSSDFSIVRICWVESLEFDELSHFDMRNGGSLMFSAHI